MIDTKNVELPIWVWRYYSTGDALQIVHIFEKYKEGFFGDLLYFVYLSNKEVSVDERIVKINNEDLDEYYSISKFSSQYQTIKAIFNKLDIRS
jgi:hypothetical protein